MDSMSAACVIVSVIFWIMAVLFAVLKEKDGFFDNLWWSCYFLGKK